ncbi:alpha-1,3/alpha-1,6-mannosyltransferase [Kwoniella heveanensis BCC8398]|uniref:Alpha-1,3/1,6-mannosyltransferase ALG2 n=1 Tax=Kwoniella heveanensis BCC8398 TaxID=1296120 RepID=A0A1B9H2D1_9TREE|nr:alpha-1,3/alpha-1,6-mannosyltransferase [Kwoniella heveanensis BCC8398]
MPIVKIKPKEKLRIGFIHPDLGIGGAERLVVDAAVSLQRLGHEVVMFTSRHDPNRCFEETRDGTLQVHVLGSSLPRSLHPKFPMTIIFSILRSLLLTFLLCTSLVMPDPPTFMNPLSPLKGFDVFIVDQQSVCVPFLRLLTGSRVLFYCHFPDKLLSGGWEISVDHKGEGKNQRVERQKGDRGVGLLKRVYRWPIDKLEEYTTGQSDIVVSNSQFTSRVYARAFPSLAKRPPRVIYPCIDVEAYQRPSSASSRKGKGKANEDQDVTLVDSDRATILSFNRFEAKKNTALAIRSFIKLRDDHLVSETEFGNLRLVLGGGYDEDELDNVQTLASLQSLCESFGLRYHVLNSPPPGSGSTVASSASPPSDVQVLFILNFSNAQRAHLLSSPHTKCLLYTPANEHFGIVPVEAMACGLPVLAADSGGPTETIVDLTSTLNDGDSAGTGMLRPPIPEEWSKALARLINLSPEEREKISTAARRRVEDKFSIATLGKELDTACKDAMKMGDLHQKIADILIWGGAGLMAFAAVGLAVIVYVQAGD